MTRLNRSLFALPLLAALAPAAAAQAPCEPALEFLHHNDTHGEYGDDGAVLLGWRFTMNESRAVTHFGMLDLWGDGIDATYDVALYTEDGTEVATGKIKAGTAHALVDDFRYAALGTAVPLAAGETYDLVCFMGHGPKEALVSSSTTAGGVKNQMAFSSALEYDGKWVVYNPTGLAHPDDAGGWPFFSSSWDFGLTLGFECAVDESGMLLAGHAAGSPVEPGGLSALHPMNYAATQAGNPSGLLSVEGLAAGLDGRVWATIGGGEILAQLDPASGEALSQIALSAGGLVGGTTAVALEDLAVQPGTGTIFGCGRHVGSPGDLELFTVDVDTGLVTFVGPIASGVNGALAFSSDGVLHGTTSDGWLLRLHTENAGVLSSMLYGPAAQIDALVASESGTYLLGTSAGSDQLLRIEIATGATAPIGSTGGAHPGDLAFYSVLEGTEVVRLGTPPNPNVLLPGQTHGPVVGTVWDPIVDHTSFAVDATIDVLAISLNPVNIPSEWGTILSPVEPTSVLLYATPGQAFASPTPNSALYVGLSLTAQAASITPTGIELTNALDLVIGTD